MVIRALDSHLFLINVDLEPPHHHHNTRFQARVEAMAPSNDISIVLAKLEELGRKADEASSKADQTNHRIEEMHQSMQILSKEQVALRVWKPELEGRVAELQNSVLDLKTKVDLFFHELPKKTVEESCHTVADEVVLGDVVHAPGAIDHLTGDQTWPMLARLSSPRLPRTDPFAPCAAAACRCRPMVGLHFPDPAAAAAGRQCPGCPAGIQVLLAPPPVCRLSSVRRPPMPGRPARIHLAHPMCAAAGVHLGSVGMQPLDRGVGLGASLTARGRKSPEAPCRLAEVQTVDAGRTEGDSLVSTGNVTYYL